MSDENLIYSESYLVKYESEFNITLPRRNIRDYVLIQKFEDYEYTNNIAYQMLKRNEEFRKITDNSLSEKNNDWILKILKLGLNPNLNFFPDKFSLNFESKDKRFFYESWMSHTIVDIEDGLNKLIEYYFNKNEIYILTDETKANNLDSYRKIENISILDIILSNYNYFIPCSVTDDFIKTNDNIKRMQQIDNTIPLRILDEEFLNSLEITDTKYKYTQLLPYYSMPEISFPQSNIVNIPVNLNLPDEEIHAYILKAKKEYQEKTLIIKHPLELIGNEYKIPEKEKSEDEFPDTREKRKIAVADAFYVYDLYKIMEIHFKKKREHFRNKRNKKIKLIQKNYKNDKDNPEKENLIISEKESCDENVKQYSKNELKRVVSIMSDFGEHKIERYYKYMKEYIDHLKYIELITGKAIN